MWSIGIFKQASTLTEADQVRHQKLVGFINEPPDRPCCKTCPSEKTQLNKWSNSSTYGYSSFCCWGGPVRFWLSDPSRTVCPRHPDYGKPWPKQEETDA